MGLDLGVDALGDINARPLRFVQVGFAPTRDFLAGVVGFAHEEIAFQDGAGRGLPTVVGDDRLRGPVGIFDDQFGCKARMGSVVVADVIPADVTAVPAIAQHGAHGVEALLELLSHVEGVVVDADAVIRPTRREIGFADRFAIQIELVVAQRRSVDRRPLDGFIQYESFAEKLDGREEQLCGLEADFAPGPGAVGGGDPRVFPTACIEVGRHPIGGGRLSGPPGAVGDNHRRGTVGIAYAQHGQDPSGVGGVALIGGIDRQNVPAGGQTVFDVDDQGLFEVAPVADGPTVDVQLEPVVGAHCTRSRFDLPVLRDVELLAEEPMSDGHRRGRVAFGIPDPGGPGQIDLTVARLLLPRGVETDPLGLPVDGTKQAHRPGRHLAPGGRFVVLVPDAHPPEALRLRFERLARVDDLCGLIRGHFAAIPEVSDLLVDLLAAAGDQDAIGPLALPALVRLDRPVQPGLDHIDAQRIHAVFAAQVVGGQPAASEGEQLSEEAGHRRGARA